MNKGFKRLAAGCVAAMMVTSVATTGLTAFAAGTNSTTSKTSSASSKASPSRMSVNVQNADVRDVFSAIAVNMGYSIIYTAEPTTLSLKMENVKPDEAFEYILKMLDLQYIPEGKNLIIGTRETLTSNFRRSLAITRFRLNYASSAIITEKIQQLNLPVTVITVESNEKMLWVQGFATDIAKVNELIQLLDIAENSASAAPTNKGGKALTYVNTGSNVTAYELDRILKTLGIDCSICLSSDDTRLYLYATTEEANSVNDILSKINTGEFAGLASGTAGFEMLTVNNISKQSAISAIGNVCPELSVLTVDNSSKSFFVSGTNDDIRRAKELLAGIDVAALNSVGNTVNTYQLQHITAAEAERRLASVAFDDGVSFYTSTAGEFANTIFVYCNEFYWGQVQALIKKIDVSNASTIGIPVFAGTQSDVETMKNVLTQLIGTQALNGAGFATVSLSGQTILYLTNADTATTNLVQQMINQLNSVLGTVDAADLSYDAYLAYCKLTGQTPSVEGYGLWVMTQLGTKPGTTSTTFAGSYAPSTATPTPAPTTAPAELLAQAESVLGGLFTYSTGSFVPTAATTVEEVLTAAREALATAGLSAVSAEENTEAVTSFTPPTTTVKGNLAVSIKLASGSSYSNYLVHLSLPFATCAVCGEAPCVCLPVQPADDAGDAGDAGIASNAGAKKASASTVVPTPAPAVSTPTPMPSRG